MSEVCQESIRFCHCHEYYRWYVISNVCVWYRTSEVQNLSSDTIASDRFRWQTLWQTGAFRHATYRNSGIDVAFRYTRPQPLLRGIPPRQTQASRHHCRCGIKVACCCVLETVTLPDRKSVPQHRAMMQQYLIAGSLTASLVSSNELTARKSAGSPHTRTLYAVVSLNLTDVMRCIHLGKHLQ